MTNTRDAQRRVAVQKPTLRRWDNATPMPCDHFMMRGVGGGYVGLHASYCNHDAAWVYVRGEDAVAFRCEPHKHCEPA